MNLRFPLRVVVFAMALIFTLERPAGAQADLACVRVSTGHILRWDASWQTDHGDQDVPYTVAEVVDNSGSVSLELGARSTANRPVRFITVGQEIASEVCAKLTPAITAKERARASLQHSQNDEAALPGIGPRTAPFIHYTEKGWVRGDPPPYQPLTQCVILRHTFACLEAERQAYGRYLDDVERDIRAAPR